MERKAYRSTFTKDGMSAAKRVGINHLALSEIYNSLVEMSWRQFFFYFFIFYFSLTLVFTLLYSLIGFDHFSGFDSNDWAKKFLAVFLYNAQTLSTVGGSGIAPQGMENSLILTLETIIAMLGMAVITGLLFIRFSRPVSGIVYSDNLLISPYRNGKALMFRLANAKKNELVELNVVFFIARNDLITDKRDVKLLKAERGRLPFLAHSWTIVHPIDQDSPLYDFDWKDGEDFQYDIAVWCNAIDRVTGQNVFSGRSYFLPDVIHNAKFLPCMEVDQEGIFHVFLKKINDYEMVNTQ